MYTHHNSRGDLYYLHEKDVHLRSGRTHTIYFFAKDEREGRCDLPVGYQVGENERSGFLYLYKI